MITEAEQLRKGAIRDWQAVWGLFRYFVRERFTNRFFRPPDLISSHKNSIARLKSGEIWKIIVFGDLVALNFVSFQSGQCAAEINRIVASPRDRGTILGSGFHW